MFATALIVLGVVMVWFGHRCAGSPGGFASDRSGVMTAAYPSVPGTARCACAWLGAALAEDVGYVALLVGVMSAL